MTKQELAACAGVSVKTMNNWLSPYREQLWDMGMPRNRGYIPPNVVNGSPSVFVSTFRRRNGITRPYSALTDIIRQ